jgi:hypothetical protein
LVAQETLVGIEVPKRDATVGGAGREDRLVEGGPVHGVDLAGVPLQDLERVVVVVFFSSGVNNPLNRDEMVPGGVCVQKTMNRKFEGKQDTKSA